MAIRKEDVLQALTRDQQAMWREYEQAIDHAITAQYDGRPLYIYRDLPSSERVRTLLKERYATAGWRLTYQYDQREGNAIILS
jgi:hypothetical protein